MTSQQDTELEDILRKFIVDTKDLDKNNNPMDEAIQALTSWKDKEVIKELEDVLGVGEPIPYEYDALNAIEKYIDERLESLQSQGGKNE